MLRALEVGTSVGATVARWGVGVRVGPLGRRPAAPLELYEFEGCPYCRKVREALSILDLEVLIRPCPKGGPRFREELNARGGKYQFPYLVDSNTGKEMYESDDIVAYLFQEYGAGSVPALLGPGLLTDASSMFASFWRPGFGVRYRAARAPERPLELYSFEASPFCRIVRETLSNLEIPYKLYNVAKGSPSRPQFVERSGKMQVPFLVDPNTGTEMFESADIVKYLENTYARIAD
ncbi:MAG: glutathione S-transferase N-terminal domain-containing protein [Myxococcales bacterium]|nr:glutathione S-transferase N-terminal domain-containing protein [Myxococcales bacterium]